MKTLTRFVASVVILGLFAAGCGKKQTEMMIFHADSLNLPMKALIEEFEKEHPNIKVEHESGGSVHMTRLVSDIRRRCDILAAADYRVLDRLMLPEHADWQLLFARNEMVLAYTGMSKGGDEITADNWYKILLRPDIQYAHSDPNLDPSGFRTLLCWRLASGFYKFDGDLYKALDDARDPRNVRPDANQIIALLEATGGIDYLFTYKSVAEQHHLQYVQLPDKINLGNPELRAHYAKAEIEVKDRKGHTTRWTGAPIAYGLTIPNTSRSPEAALLFVRFALSDKGAKIMAAEYQPVITPALRKGNNVPRELISLTKPLEQP